MTRTPEALPTSGPWLTWTLRIVDIQEGGDPRELEYEDPPTGRYDELTAWLQGYVRHGIDPRATLTVRWSEPHSVGHIIRDGDGTLIARATITAAESDAPPPRMREQECCDREMSVISRSGFPMLLCHECGHHEPRF